MKPIIKGEYVLATKYSDGDPRDHWAVGFFDRTQGDRHFIVGNDGQQLRANGFRRIGRITPEKGAWLLRNSRDIEMSGRSVWGFARRSLSKRHASRSDWEREARIGHSSVVSFSGGKDSTAMLHLLLEQGVPVSHVVYFETEWDFPQMRAHLDLVTAKTGLRIIRVRYYRYFEEMLALWGWPKSAGGWCTARKHRTCVKYVGHIKGNKTEYIGFSADEVKRTQTKWMTERRWPVKFPLIDAGMGEADSLAYCKRLGYHWDGLYEVFDRVSCFCCPKGGKTKRRLIRENFPELEREWQRLDAVACMSNEGLSDDVRPGRE